MNNGATAAQLKTICHFRLMNSPECMSCSCIRWKSLFVVKFNVDNIALAKIIYENGYPPRQASCKGLEFWVRATIATCKKRKTSLKLIKYPSVLGGI